MFNRILVIGATGPLGKPVVESLTKGRHTVRILTRSLAEGRNTLRRHRRTRQGSATNIDDVRAAMAGCDAVHINLTPATEYAATSHVIEAPTITLDDWFGMERDERGGIAD